jgi:hypothetical protein
MFRCSRIAPLLALAGATLITSNALAAPTLPGINVRWDNCYADGGVMNKAFACDTNTGFETVVLSVQLDTPMLDVSGMEIRVSLKASVPALPAWWEYRQSPLSEGGCRETSLSFIASPTLPSGNCVDWGEGRQAGGIGAYRWDELGPGSAVLLIAAAVPSSSLVPQLDPVTEYIVGGLRINHAKTVGTGSCAGCATPVCILFTSLVITTPVIANDRLFTTGANGVDSQIIHWQNGQLTNLVNHCTSTHNCTTEFDCVNISPTASRRNTWGEVKALYR